MTCETMDIGIGPRSSSRRQPSHVRATPVRTALLPHWLARVLGIAPSADGQAQLESAQAIEAIEARSSNLRARRATARAGGLEALMDLANYRAFPMIWLSRGGDHPGRGGALPRVF